MIPWYLVFPRIGFDWTLKVHVIAFFDVVWVQCAAKRKRYHWRIWNKRTEKIKLEVLYLPPGYNGIKANVQTGPVTRSWSIGDKNHPKIDFKMLQPLTLIPKAIRVLIHLKFVKNFVCGTAKWSAWQYRLFHKNRVVRCQRLWQTITRFNVVHACTV